MILTGNKIKKEVKKGNIIIGDFDIENISTNSYDICLGNKIIKYTDDILDPKKENKYEEIIIPEDGLVLEKGSFRLGSSNEIIGSTKYVPIIHARSGIARLGLFVHVTADLIDIGSIGKITFQLHATVPIKIYPGLKIAQVSFWKPKGKIILYEGKYQGSDGPVTSKTYLDY
jgi:dCTP deaminase